MWLARSDFPEEEDATPVALKRKAVSPGDKTRPFGSDVEIMVPRPDPVGPTAKMVRDGLNRRLPEDWQGVLESDDTLRLGLRVAPPGTGKNHGRRGRLEQHARGVGVAPWVVEGL